LLFRKRQRRGAGAPASEAPGQAPQLYRIDFDMMLKGSTCRRRREVVRQFGVTVNGATRLVTSGDVVDRETYYALLAAGAIRPGGASGSASPHAARPEPSDSQALETAAERSSEE